MLPAPLPPLALALPGPALRPAVAAATLFATWALARFLAVGIAHHRRHAELDRRLPGEAEIDAWRWAVRRELYSRWVRPRSPRAALAAAPVAGLLGPRPIVGEEPGLHLVVGPPGTGTSATLWAALAAVLADPADDDPVPLVVDVARLARIPPAAGSPSPLDRLVTAELVDLTGMPDPVAERLADEAVLLVDGFEDLLASSPAAAADLLTAVGGRLGGTQGVHAVLAIARSRNGRAVAARRIVVATTQAGHEAFARAGLAGDEGPLATVTYLEPADGVSLRAAVGTVQPPCPGLLAALDRLPGLAPLLGHPLWLDVALEVFGHVPDDRGDRPGAVTDDREDRAGAVTGALDHLPPTAGAEEIAGALWDRWLDRRLPGCPDAWRHTAALARRHPPRSQPTFHLHDLGRRGTGAQAWFEGMRVAAGPTFLLATLMAFLAPGWTTAALCLFSAIATGALFTWVLQRHEGRTAGLAPVPQAEGSEDGDGPAAAGVATGLLVMMIVIGRFVLAGTGASPGLLLAPLLIAVPLGVTGWLAFRARLGVGRQWPALLSLGALGGALGAMVFASVLALDYGNGPYPFPGDPADIMGWWTAALIVGPVVGLVDGMGLPGSGPVRLRLRPDPATTSFGGSLPPMVAVPVIGSVLVSGPLFLIVLVQPEFAPWLAPFAAGGLVVGLAAWVAAGATAGFTPDPGARPPIDPASTVTAELHRTMWRMLLAAVATGLVVVPAAWLTGRWLSRQKLGPAQEVNFLGRTQVPMVSSVLTGVAVCVGLWLLATLVTTGPVRQRVVQAVAAARGRVPGDYAAFLDELVAAGVLHRCGAGYRFRHPSLADHLAGRPALPPAEPGAPHDAFDPAPSPVAV